MARVASSASVRFCIRYLRALYALVSSKRSAPPSVSRVRKLSAGVLRLLTVLLEEHPLQRTRPSETIVREERGAAREVEQDRVGFWQKLSFCGLEHGDAPVRVDVFEERGRARLTPVYVVLDPLEWNTKLCQQQPDLVTVPRWQVVVQAQSHLDSPPSGP